MRFRDQVRHVLCWAWLLVCLLGGPAQADTSWVGAVSTNWFEPGNWSAGVPATNVDTYIGDASFVGPYQPGLPSTGVGYCRSLTLGGGAVPVTLTVYYSLTVNSNLTIGGNATLNHIVTSTSRPLTVKGSWTNLGAYLAPNVNATVTFAGKTQYLAGATSFQRLSANGGSVVLLQTNIVVKTQFTVAGTFDPGEAPANTVSGAGKLTVSSGGILRVTTPTFTGNYPLTNTILLSANSTVSYSGSGNQSVSSALTYSTLMLAGSGTKSLTNNLPPLLSTSTSYGRITVSSGTFDLGPFTANRGTNNVGGTLTVSAGARLRLTGSGNFPNLNSASLHAASTVEYAGGNQIVAGKNYGTLLLSSSGGAAVKYFPTNLITVYSNLTASAAAGSSLLFTSVAPVSVRGYLTLGSGTTFHGGGVTNTFSKSWTNDGTFLGGSGTVSLSGLNAVITGSGTYNLNHVALANTGITVSPDTTLTIGGNLKASSSYYFTHVPGGSGAIVFTGAGAVISGQRIAFSNLRIPGSVTTATTLTVVGDMDVSGSFTATAGTFTFTGAGRRLTGAGSITLYALSVPGSLTVDASLAIRSAFTVAGSFNARSGAMSFLGSTTFSGTAQLADAVLNGTLLRLSAGSTLKLGGNTIPISGSFDASRYKPNLVVYNGGDGQPVFPITYHNLQIAGVGTKTAVGRTAVNGDFTIASGSGFSAGSAGETNVVAGHWYNYGVFDAGNGTVEFTGSYDSTINGETTFNQLVCRKSRSATQLVLATNITAATLTMTVGTLQTGTNTLTVTGDRRGPGTVLGTLTHAHAFEAGVPYVFESPYTTVLFDSLTTVTSVTMTAVLQAPEGFPFGGSISRRYEVGLAADGPYSATLQLHYLDSETGGQLEEDLQLWHADPVWAAAGRGAGDVVANWVQQTNLPSIVGTWTLSDDQNVAGWTGAEDSRWSNPANWVVVEGFPNLPPGELETVEFGGLAFTNPPLVEAVTTVRGVIFGSHQSTSLRIQPGGALTVEGSVRGVWTNEIAHVIEVGDQALRVGGRLSLTDGVSNHVIHVRVGAGELSVTNTLTVDGGASLEFSGAGQLHLGGDFLLADGTFSAPETAVTYNGDGPQVIAGGVTYHSLDIAKDAGTATLARPASVSSNLVLSGSSILNLQADLAVAGDVRLGADTTLYAGAAGLAVGGDWINDGTFIPETGRVTFNGAGTQSVSGSDFYAIAVDKPSGSVVLAGDVVLGNDLEVARGVLDLGVYAADRAALGASLVLGAGAGLRTASHFPANFANRALDATSRVEYYGSGAQAVSAETYGHLALNHGAPAAKSLQDDTVVVGNLVVGEDAVLDAADFGLTLHGDWEQRGGFVPGLGLVVLAGEGRSLEGVITLNDLAVPGSHTVTGGSLHIQGNVTVNGTLDIGASAVTLDGDLQNAGALVSRGVTTFTGTRLQTIRLINALQSTSAGVVNFNGTVSPLLESTTPPLFANLNINNTGGVVPSVPWTVYGAFTTGPGAVFDGGELSHVFYGPLTNRGTLTGTGTLVFHALSSETLDFGSSFAHLGTVIFEGSGAIAFAGGPLAFNNVTLANTHPAGVTAVSGWTLDADFTIGTGATFHAGAGLSHGFNGNLVNDGTFEGGTSLCRLNATTISGSGSTTFCHLLGLPDLGLVFLSPVSITGSFTNNTSLNATATRVTFTGPTPAQLVAPAVNNTFGTVEVDKPGSRLTCSGLSVLTGLTLQAGTFELTAGSVPGASAATLTIADAAALVLSGTSAFPTFGSYALSAGSTVEYAGAGAQTIAAHSYGNLTSSSTGSRTLAPGGVIRIAGAFTPGGNAYVTPGSTVDYSGSGPQTIAAFAYHHLASSGAGPRTLAPAGTIGIAGTFDPGNGSFAVDQSTVVFSGSSQVVPAFTFHHLTVAGAGLRTLGGEVTVLGTLALGGGTLADAGHTLQVQGDFINQATHSGAGSIRLAAGAVPHRLSGTGTSSHLELDDPLGAVLATNDLVVAGVLSLRDGLLSSGTNTVCLGSDARVERATGYVNGRLQKPIPTGAITRTFEIGDTNGYAPVQLVFDQVTTAGTVAAVSTPGPHPDLAESGLDSDPAVNRYWSLTNQGAVFTACDVTLMFPVGDLGPGAESGYYIAALRDGGWSRLTASESTPTSLLLSGLTEFGDFAIGEPAEGSGTWSRAAGGSWGATTNWLDSRIAIGPGRTADFSALSLAAQAVVTLDLPRTIGHLRFADQANACDWLFTTLTASPLTLSASSGTPSITVSNRTATLQLELGGTNGLEVAGPGVLVVAGANTYSGPTRVLSGATLRVSHSDGLGTTNDATTVDDGGTLELGVDGLVLTEDLTLQGQGLGAGGALSTGPSLDPHLAGAVTIAADDTVLSVDAPGAVLSVDGAFHLAHDVVLGSALRPQGTAEFHGPIDGAGALRVSGPEGAGLRVDLFAANTFTGDAEVAEGALVLHHRDALQASTLHWSAAADASPHGDLRFEGIAEATLGGLEGDRALALPNHFTLQVGDAQVSTLYSGSLSGTDASLVKAGSGSLTLAGASTFSGGVRILDGPTNVALSSPGNAAIIVTDRHALGSGPVVLGSAVDSLRALEFDLTGNALVANALVLPASGPTRLGILGRDATSDFTLAGPIHGGHAGLELWLSPASGGVLRLASDASDFTAIVTVPSGTLALGDAGALGAPGNLLRLDQRSSASASLRFDADLSSLPQAITVGGAAVIDVSGHEVTLSGSLGSLTSGEPLLLRGGQISGGSSVGSLTLAADNDALGSLIRLNAHNTTLVVASTNALGDPAFGTVIDPSVNNATVAFADVGDYSLPEPLTLRGRGALRSGTGVGALQNVSGHNRFPGPVALAADSAIGVAADVLTLTGDVQGPGALAKIGPGVLVLTGSDRAGSTTVEEGTLQFGDGLSSGLVSCDITNRATLVFHPATALVFTNGIHGTGSVEKAGSGALILAAQNVHTGPTVVEEGTLILAEPSGVGAITVSALTVRTNGSLVFSNHNQLSTSVNLTLDGGRVRPGGCSNQLGTLLLTDVSTVEYTPGAPSRLEFGPSNHDAWDRSMRCSSCHNPDVELTNNATWNHHLLVVTNWSSADVLRFGTDATGLGGGGPEFRQVQFVNYDNTGLTTNGYIRPDGVVVPTTRVNHSAAFRIQTQPSAAAVAGSPLDQGPAVVLLDEFGVIDATDNTTMVSVRGSGPLSGTLSCRVTNGVATFGDLVLTRSGTNRLTFITGMFPPVTSDPVVVAAATATRLAFADQPVLETDGQPFSRPPVVEVVDAYNNPTADLPASLPVALVLASGSGTLSGTATLDLGTDGVGGRITFNGLAVEGFGSNFVLVASAAGVADATSEGFVVVPRNSPPSITGWHGSTRENLHAFGAPSANGMYLKAGVTLGADGFLYATTYTGGPEVAGTIIRVTREGTEFAVLHAFSGPDGRNPMAGLTEGFNGALYGTTFNGGNYGKGTLFTIYPDGTGFAVLHHFDDAVDGGHPVAELLQGDDGLLYGTTTAGGADGAGTVFVIGPDGSGFGVLHSFGRDADGRTPRAPLMQGADGALYGTTELGGAHGAGTVCRIEPDGSGYQVLADLEGGAGPAYPRGALVQGDDDRLYGTSMAGGTASVGTVFALQPDGTGFTVLHEFAGPDGMNPCAALIVGEDGLLYGTAYSGGPTGRGTAFRLTTAGTDLSVLYAFAGEGDANASSAPLIQAPDGTLFGTTYYGGPDEIGTVFALHTDGSGYAVVLGLQLGDTSEAWSPDAALIEIAPGVLCGTTYDGGAWGAGTVFRVQTDGLGYTVLHEFNPGAGEGESVYSSLVLGLDGALYGTTMAGGAHDAGTAFRLQPDGSRFSTLHSFGANSTDGVRLYSGLVQDAEGTWYGTTDSGGAYGAGTVFAMNADGSNYRLLHHFGADFAEGANPSATLLLGADGRLFGSTVYGGTFNCGVVFGMAADGTGFTVLHEFGDLLDGALPNAALTQGPDGRLFGTTSAGGILNSGTVFAMDPDGSHYAVLWDFTAQDDGVGAYSSLTRATGERLVGTTYYGGGSDWGVVFSLRPDGTDYQVVYRFGAATEDGANPYVAPVEGADLALYGVTEVGGAYAQGTAFRLNVLTNLTVAALDTLNITFTAEDVDDPPQRITYTLLSGPSGMSVGSANGVLSWTPGDDVVAGDYAAQVRVADNGTPPLTATYAFAVSVITPARPTAIQLTSGAITATLGETGSLVGTVPQSHGRWTPTGSVTFLDGAEVLGTVALDAASASLPLTWTHVGLRALTAIYSGDARFLASTGTLALVVERASQASLAFTPATSQVFGTTNTLTAAGGSGSGAVTFSVLSGPGLLVNGNQLVLTAGSGAVRVQALKAGDSDFNDASTVATIQAAPAPSSAGFSSSPNPSIPGQAILLTAQVLGAHGSPAGSVAFLDHATSLGSAVIDGSGRASLTVRSLTVGTHTVSAIYTGDANFTGTTQTLTHVVQQHPSSLTLASRPNPSAAGQPVVLVAQIETDSLLATGTVRLTDGTNEIGSVLLDANGTAGFTLTNLDVGTHRLTAMYSGDAVFLPASQDASQDVFQLSPAAGPLAGANTVILTHSDAFGDPADITTLRLGSSPATITRRGSNWVEFVAPAADVSGPVDLGIDSSTIGSLVVTNAYLYHAPGFLFDNEAGRTPGVNPAAGSSLGGDVVILNGTGLGDGSDITRVVLCGIDAAILSQSATQLVVTTGPTAVPGVGEIQVTSTSRGVTTKPAAFTYLKFDQTISFADPGPQQTTNLLTLQPTASSGLPVTLTLVEGPARFADTNTLAFTGVGTVVLTASQPGNDAWTAAPDETVVFQVDPTPASVVLAGLDQTYDGTGRAVSATTLPPGLPVEITYDDWTVPPVAVGHYAVRATVADPRYLGTANGTLTVSRATQTLSFPAIPDQPRTNVLALEASASSGLPVEFALVSGPAQFADATHVTFTGRGVVSIAALQPGDGNYEAAAGVTNSFQTLGTDPGSLVLETNALEFTAVWGGTNPAVQPITLTNPGELGLTFGNVIDWIGSSNQWFSLSPDSAALTGGSSLVLTARVDVAGLAPGTYLITNTLVSAEAANSPVELVIQLTVSRAEQSLLAFAPVTPQVYGTTNILVALGGSGSGELTYTVTSGPGQIIDGDQLVLTDGVGTVVVEARRSADAFYNEAHASAAVEATPAAVTVLDLAQVYDGSSRPVRVTTAPAGLAVDVTYDGSATPPVSAGSYAVIAAVAGVPHGGTASATLTVSRATQTLSFPAIPDQPRTNVLALEASASSGLPVEFALVSGPAQFADATHVTFTGRGVVSIAALQPGDGNYEAAAGVTNSFQTLGTDPGSLVLATNALEFTAVWGGTNPAVQPITLTNPGELGLTFSNVIDWVGSSNQWFSVSPDTAALAGGSSLVLTARVDVAGLAPGTYLITNTLMSAEAANSPVTFSVRCTILAPEFLHPMPDVSAFVLVSLAVTNEVVDYPWLVEPLVFSLDAGAPSGMHIHPGSGVLRWNPTRDQAHTTQSVTVRVTDGATPPRVATNSYSIRVEDFAELVVDRSIVFAGQTGALTLTLVSSADVTNLEAVLTLEKPALSEPVILSRAPEVGDATITELAPGQWQVVAAAAPGAVFHGTQALAQVSFVASTNRPAFVAVDAVDILARQTNGSSMPWTFGTAGRVTIVMAEPILDSLSSPGTQAGIVLYGMPGHEYEVFASPDLFSAPSWTPLWLGTMSGDARIPLPDISNLGPGQAVFFRAVDRGP